MFTVPRSSLELSKKFLRGGCSLFASWVLTIAIVGGIAIIGWSQQVLAVSNVPNENTWVTNDIVRAVADNGTTIIIGGDFSYVGPNTGSAVPLSNSSGSLVPPYPKVNGPVYAVVPDGFGGWFIGGDFSRVGNEDRNNIARILSTGAVSTWYPTNGANAPVRALALVANASGRTLYVGGEFTNIGGGSRSFAAALNASTGSLKAWKANPDDFVRALAVNGPVVYMGGDFWAVGTESRNYLAAVDNSTGAVTTWDPNADDTVEVLAVSGGIVYAGGVFSAIGFDARGRIAAIDASTGAATGWNPSADDTVNALVVNGATVYTGGSFGNIGGGSRNRIAAIDATTGLATAWNPNANGTVISLAVDGTTVYAGGSFSTIGGSTRNRIAALDASTGVASSWNPNVHGLSSSQVAVNALVVSGTKVFAGGSFTSVGGDSRFYLAALNASTGALTSWKHNANGSVHALALEEHDGTKTLYVGGGFTTISGGQPRNHIASFDLLTGSLNEWNPDGNDTVLALAANGPTVYAGGKFTRIGGQHRNYIAALDETGNATSWDPDADSWVSALATSGNTVYAGGLFSFIGNAFRDSLAGLDVDTGNATSWNPGVSGYVYALALNGSTVYLGGDFGMVGDQERSYLAAVDVDTGIPTAWNPTADAPAWALAVNDKHVYAGGEFTLFKDVNERPYLASLEIGLGDPTSWNPIPNNTVYALAVLQKAVYAGGAFTSMSSGAISQPYFAEFPTGYVVSGRVTSGGAAVAGVTVSLTGAATQSTSTDINGDYRFTGVFDGAYTITPSQVDYTFTPQRINVTVSGADVSGQNFAATAIGYSVSGKVTSGGAAVAGVTVSLTGAATKSTTTDGNGNYSFSGLVNGVYTVSASMAGYTITPQSYTFNINGANVSGKDFTATLITYSISGKVSIDGAGLSGVSVNLTGGVTKSTTTDGNGNYSFSGLLDGAYTVTPSKSGYTMAPQSRSVSVSGADVAGQDFIAALPTYSISGRVTTVGYAFPGVTVSLTGGATKSTTTDGNGNYSFTGISDGAYIITPSKIGYSFTPSSINVNVSGADVVGQDFTAPLGAATLLSPSGTISTSTPAYSWNAVPGSTWYYLYVNDSTGTRITTWYSASQAGCAGGTGTCSIEPGTVLAPGSATWWVQSYGASGNGPWSNSMSFTVPPGQATLISPSGTISTSTPAYSWNAVPGSTWYYLYVNDSKGTRITSWYSASQAGCAGGTGTCTVSPGTVLATGSGVWWVQTYGSNGYGPCSNSKAFTVPVPPSPGKVTLVSPSGVISTTTPLYTWNADPNSTWYLLYVNDSTGNKISNWYSASQAGCSGGTGTCSIEPGTVLAPGSATWWIQSYGAAGNGPWSNGMTFTVPPGQATLISPSGTISTATPSYSWNAVPGSTWYYLYVNDNTGTRITHWYSASEAGCSEGTGTCAVSPGTLLATGSGVWWVQTYGPNGYGPWSNSMAFTVSP